MWCASTRVWQLLPADPRASNWRAGRQREFLYAPFLQASDLKLLAPVVRSSQVALVQRFHHWKELRRARCSFAALECCQASNGEPWRAWLPQGWFRLFCPWMRQTAERNTPRAREYRLSFREGVADKLEKHSAGNTNLREIHGPEPFASGPGWSQQRREHRLALCVYFRLPRTHAPGARGAAWVEAPMACLQFHRGTACRDPQRRTGRHENCSRDDFFAGAGVSGDQDGCIRACNRVHLAENGAQGAAASYDRV